MSLPGSHPLAGGGPSTGTNPLAGGNALAGGNPFAGDDGAPDPAVRAALHVLTTSGEATPRERDEAHVALLAALLHGRVLLPVVTAPPAVAQAWADEGHSHDHHDDHEHAHDHEHDEHAHEPDEHAHAHDHPHQHPGQGDDPAPAMAAVRLVVPDGRSGLPVFTGLDALTAWNPTARPLPMTAPDAARMALDEGCEVLLVDLADPHACVLGSAQVWALAQDRAWLPAYRDELVRTAVAEAAHGIPGALAAHPAPTGAHDEPGTLVVELTLAPGLNAAQVNSAASTVGERLAGDPQIRCRLDGVRLVLRSG